MVSMDPGKKFKRRRKIYEIPIDVELTPGATIWLTLKEKGCEPLLTIKQVSEGHNISQYAFRRRESVGTIPAVFRTAG